MSDAMSRVRRPVLFLCLMLLPAYVHASDGAARPDTWARPLSAPWLKNFHRVSENVYRGAQPGREGFEQLKKLGVRTVLNLREHHSDEESMEGLEFRYIHLPVSTTSPDTNQFEQIIRILSDTAAGPVFVHCKHGSDRTGAAVALYRIRRQGWPADDAIREMTRGGYGYHFFFRDIVKLVRELSAPTGDGVGR